MESHPEEDDHGEHEAQRHDAVFCLLGRELRLGVLSRHVGSCGLRVAVGVFERAAEGVVDGDAHHEREAGHGESVVVGVGWRGSPVGLGVLHDFDGGRRCEEGADVDGHVEDGESRVALALQLGVVVEVAHHHLQIAFKEARADAHHEQGGKHEHHGGHAVACRDGEHEVAQKHHDDARRHAFAVADAVGQRAAHEGQKIDQGQEASIDGAGRAFRPAEVGFQEEREDGQHGVIAEALAGVGEGQGKQSFGLSFKHSFSFWFMISDWMFLPFRPSGRPLWPRRRAAGRRG